MLIKGNKYFFYSLYNLLCIIRRENVYNDDVY